MLWVDQLGE
jgi:hypothetical protein